jgi:hypothetical protein
MSALSNLLSAANTSSMSGRSIAREARERGHTLNHDTAARYLRGAHGVPDESTLLAFADVLDVPLAQLREAADLPFESTTPYDPPAEASRLTRRQRRAVDEIIRAMLEPSAESPTGRDRLRAAPAPDRAAARHGDPEPQGDTQP